MDTPGYQLLLHLDGTITASRRRYGSQEAAETAADHLTNALLPFNEGEPEDVVWVEVVEAAPEKPNTVGETVVAGERTTDFGSNARLAISMIKENGGWGPFILSR